MPGTLVELLRFAVGAAVLLSPGVFAASWLVPQRPAADRLLVGCAVSLAAAVYLAVALAYVRLWLFYPAWLLLGASLAVCWCKRGMPLRPRSDSIGRLVVIVLALVAVSRFALALRYELPPGWDPSFHLLLARKLATTGRMIFDWRPFEDIALNYPLGSHALVVVFSRIAGLPLHATFRLLLPMLGVFSTAMVYVFARDLSDDREVGLLAALTHGLWAVYGSIDYYRWGGLPNLLGMLFVMTALVLLLNRRAGRRDAALFALLFTAIFLTHHHVMITAGIVFSALVAYFLLTKPRDGRHRVILFGLVGATVLGSFYVVPYALKASTLGGTGTLTFTEMFYDFRAIADSVGVAFLVASLVGIAVHRLARRPSSQLGVLYVVSGTLVVLFVFFEYGWRAISWRAYGDSYVAFTPSRFLTDLAYFSSVFAGYGLYQMRRWVRVPLLVVVVLCVPVAATNRTAWAKAAVPTGSPDLLKAYQWVDRTTPADTLVVTTNAWAPYLTWRRCSVTPVPISEPSTADTPKARLFEAIDQVGVPPEAASTKIIQVALPGATVRPGRILWRGDSGVVVVDLNPGAPWRTP